MQLCVLTAAFAAAAQPQRHWLLLPQPIFDRLPDPAVFGLGIMAGILAVVVTRSWRRTRAPRPAARQAGLPASAPVAIEPLLVAPPGEPVPRPAEPAGADRPAQAADPLVGTEVTATLLPDLEGLRVTLADGPPELVQALLDDAAAELAAGAIGPCELVLVGFSGGSREASTHCEQVTAALDLVAARTVAARRRRTETPAPPSPPVPATIIVSQIPATSTELSMLADLISEPGRMAALLPAGPGRSGRRVERAAMLGLGYGDTGVVTTLRPAPERVPAALRIGVLGQLTINGQPGALLPAQTQLLVALALNSPAGLLNRQLCDLLGSDSEHPKPADSLRQLIARTRRQLGSADDGREWILHLGHGRYGLHEHSRLDWAEFEALTGEGIASRDAAKLAAALAMIRGQPFTGCFYWWLDIELVESVGARILAAASTLAEVALAGRDPAAAGRAARIGLVADSTAERLWRLLMEAEHAAGNLAGVREAWARCVEAISDIAVDGQPEAATTALYRRLVSR